MMKSSVCGYLPWTWTSGHKCDSTSNSMKSKSNKDCGNMKEAVIYGNQHQQQKKRPMNSKASAKVSSPLKSKVSPLLRLDSQGEIANSSSHNFCDRSVNIQSLNKLGLSNSFDSYSVQESTARPRSSTGISIGLNNCKNHIPHPPFQKSNSIPANVKMPAHQSFPPPASSFTSAIRSNSFSCPATEKLSPFSSSPRNLGHVDVFGGNHKSNSSCDHQQCSVSFTFDSSDIMNRSKKVDACKSQSSGSNVSEQESKVECNGMEDIMTSVKLKKVGKEKVSASPVNGLLPSVQSSINCSSSSSNFSSPNLNDCSVDKDLSYILFLRKPKKRRTRNKRRNRHQTQKQDSDNQSFRPSSCSSPIKDDSKASSPSLACMENIDNDFSPTVSSPINSSASKCQTQTSAIESPVPTSSPSQPSCSSFILFTSADSDNSSQLSDDDFDSVVFSEDVASPSRKCAKKRKYKQKDSQKEKSPCDEIDSDLESDNEQKSSSLSALHFTFVGLAVSEDEDNDSVDWGDLSTSPSASDPQLIFEFEFNTGLSLEAIIGGQSTPTDCPALSKELQDLNKRWNELYDDSSSLDDGSSQQLPKVHFAGEEDLVTVHIVGDEDRGGDWHHYATERARFQKKIKDIESVIAPALCVSHRAKVLERMNVTLES